jgi:hypothetical protein
MSHDSKPDSTRKNQIGFVEFSFSTCANFVNDGSEFVHPTGRAVATIEADRAALLSRPTFAIIRSNP